MYWVILRRGASQMQRELATAFQDRTDIRVIQERRYGDRRSQPKEVPVNRRRTDRRRGLVPATRPKPPASIRHRPRSL